MIIRVVEWMHCTGKYTNAEENCSLWVLGVHYIDIQRFIDGRPFAGLSFERSVERAASKLLVDHWTFRPRDDQIENCPAGTINKPSGNKDEISGKISLTFGWISPLMIELFEVHSNLRGASWLRVTWGVSTAWWKDHLFHVHECHMHQSTITGRQRLSAIMEEIWDKIGGWQVRVKNLITSKIQPR